MHGDWRFDCRILILVQMSNWDDDGGHTDISDNNEDNEDNEEHESESRAA